MDDTKMNESEIVSSTEVLRTVLLLPPASFFHRLDFVYSAWTGTDDKYDSKRFKINGKYVFLFPDEVPDGPGTDIGAVDGAQEVIPSHEHAAKTGTSLWDCSIVLSKFIEEMTLKNVVEAKRERYGVSGKKVIELGSGIGLLGISMYQLPAAHITFTDLPALIDRLPATLALNSISPTESRVSLVPLDWTTFNPTHPLAKQQSAPETRAEIIVASDVLWLPHLVPPFVDTLAFLLVDPSQLFIMGYQERSSRVTEIFTAGLAERGMKWKVVEWDGMARGAEWERPGIEIWEVRRGA